VPSGLQDFFDVLPPLSLWSSSKKKFGNIGFSALDQLFFGSPPPCLGLASGVFPPPSSLPFRVVRAERLQISKDSRLPFRVSGGFERECIFLRRSSPSVLLISVWRIASFSLTSSLRYSTARSPILLKPPSGAPLASLESNYH